jgi:hypothetical protein
VWRPDRERYGRWLTRHVVRRGNGGQQMAMAVEGRTGWRYVVEETTAAGFGAHVAEPADTQAARGPKRHAKTDRSDARMLRDDLQPRGAGGQPRCRRNPLRQVPSLAVEEAHRRGWMPLVPEIDASATLDRLERLTRENTELHEELEAFGIVLLALQRLGRPTAIDN